MRRKAVRFILGAVDGNPDDLAFALFGSTDPPSVTSAEVSIDEVLRVGIDIVSVIVIHLGNDTVH